MEFNNTLVIGLVGLALTSQERQHLLHPYVAGVILFRRNYASIEQLQKLTQSIHDVRPDLLIGVDQEGGRVQRFHEGFTRLPAAREIGLHYDQSAAEGLAMAYRIGNTMASELVACGVNVSFAPVADLYLAESKVIASRAFHPDPYIVGKLSIAYFQGMKAAGVMAVAKHFPGHGSIIGDTHVEQVIDHRSWQEIEQQDLVPFKQLSLAQIPAMMAAHVCYPQLDDKPAGLSVFWLKTILRERLGFQGLIFSDDLGMQAAKLQGSAYQLIKQAIQAGCDRVLLCNEFDVIAKLLS